MKEDFDGTAAQVLMDAVEQVIENVTWVNDAQGIISKQDFNALEKTLNEAGSAAATSTPATDLEMALKTVIAAGYIPLPEKPSDAILDEIWIDSGFSLNAIRARYKAMLNAGMQELQKLNDGGAENE